MRHRDRIVPGKELLDTVWAGESVTAAVLTTTLRTLRRAIGETGRQQRLISTVHGRGYQFVAPTAVRPRESAPTAVAPTGSVPTAVADAPAGPGVADTAASDVIRFCRTADGARIAWAATGTGPILVKAANWLSRIDIEGTTPIFAHWREALIRDRRVIRYDSRGCGLSEPTATFAVDEWVDDLDAVAGAAGLDRFPLLGVCHGGAQAVAYAAHRPERVSRLVLNAAVVQGRLARARDDAERAAAALDMQVDLAGWHGQERSYLRFFGAQFFAGSPPQWWDDLTDYRQRTASAASGARQLELHSVVDVLGLAHRVSCPTLILHSRDDPRVPVSQAEELADRIPHSRLVVLDGSNHLLTADEPAWPAFLAELHAFLAEEEPGRG
ncbi:alpha/beta fold hydrolase [Plantactinospora sp. WMMB334]|uniref:alpha/beta fold hydrolase n=1 Tax=Plantactinospora sp. WMMB334 TaxID=3404119 RepID=UPI003B92DC34